MPDGFVQLPTDAAGKKLRTWILPNGEHAEAVVLVDTDGYIVSSPESPQVSTLTSVNLAAGASVNLDAPAVNATKVGQLERIVIAASVPLKAELQRVVSATPSTFMVIFTTDAELTREYKPPHKKVHTLVAGDNFRVRLTNQDTIDAADVYVTVVYDEVS